MAINAESPVLEAESADVQRLPMSKADIKHNMILLVLIDTIWLFGWTEMMLASSPLYKYLGMSNTMIGLMNFTFILGLFGIFASPFITIHFRFKKFYMFCAHIPYLLPWGLIGFAVIFSSKLGLTNNFLIWFILIANGVSGLAAGFVTLPHQEYIAACIPMSHRGRLSGYGNALGSGLAVISNSIAIWMLMHLKQPGSYGYLYVMTWAICQGGYIVSLFARERPTPVEKSPKPWSKTMISRAIHDRPFLQVIGLQAIYAAFIMPIFQIFMIMYGLKQLSMPDQAAGISGVTQRLFTLLVCVFIGHLIDRWSPKIFFHRLPFAICLAFAPVLIWHNPAVVYTLPFINVAFHPAMIAVYASIALSQMVHVGQYGSFNALVFGLPAPEDRAGHFTFQIIAVYIAQSCGPLILGYFLDIYSYMPVFVAVFIFAILLLPLTRFLLKPLSTQAKDYT